MTIQWLGDIEMYPWIAQVLIGCFKLHFGVLNSDWLVQVWEMAEHNMADWQNIYGWLTEHMADWQSIMADWQSIMADWQSIMADWQSITGFVCEPVCLYYTQKYIFQVSLFLPKAPNCG